MSEEEQRFYETVWMWIKLPHVFSKRVFSAIVDRNEQLDDSIVVERRVIAKSNRALRTASERVEISKLRREATFELLSDVAVQSAQKQVSLSYKLLLVEGQLHVEVVHADEATNDFDQSLFSRAYIESTLRCKLTEFWGKCSNKQSQDEQPKELRMDDSLVLNRSLNLVDHVAYYANYMDLKRKYAALIAANWCERTAAEKFIHEELAIAAYLITLWQSVYPSDSTDVSGASDCSSCRCACACSQVRNSKGKRPTFVDLGCGNGMLVFVLNSEGYAGVGVDVRERRSWKFYKERIGAQKLVTLQLNPAQCVLDSQPSCDCRCEWPFAACDWLIGNHADELSCWLPVLASRFNHAGFFLLPCCAFEFSGARFSFRRPAESLYRTYLRYVHHVALRCGYSASLKQDRLRIPSTKRICYVASSTPRRDSVDFAALITDHDFRRQLANVPNDVAFDDADDVLDDDKHEHDEPTPLTTSSADAIAKMQLRSCVEPVRNCGALPAEFKCSLLFKIVSLLLNAPDASAVDCDSRTAPDDGPAAKSATRRWNSGGRLRLEQLAAQLSREELQLLKAQCGGLQTFVRNHRHVLSCDKALVALSRPLCKRDCSESSRLQLLASKPCWFALNHPDGCLFTEDQCACSHNLAQVSPASQTPKDV